MTPGGDERVLLIDASVFITLSEVGRVDVLESLDGDAVMPAPVEAEIVADPAAERLDAATESGWIRIVDAVPLAECREAAAYLGKETPADSANAEWMDGDTAILGSALFDRNSVVITDDKPLRKACKSIGIEISGSIGVLVAAVEHEHLGADEAKRTLVAMDEVGARLSASLLKRAERLIDEAAEGDGT